MYNKLYIPVLNEIFDKHKETYIKEFKRLNCQNVILGIDTYIIDSKKQKEFFLSLKNNINFLKDNGFNVTVWLWSFMIPEKNNFLHITSPQGIVSEKEICPSDKGFINFACEYISSISKLNPDMILFDDDFGMGFQDCGYGCVCKNHIEYMENLLNEKLDNIDLKEYILKGGKNKYRSALLKANRYFIENFCTSIRQAVDKVNKNIRFGICSCMDVWDTSNISTYEVAKLLAGDTLPFIRLIGAPYWNAFKFFGNRLQDVIDMERMETTWIKQDSNEYEIVCEGDAFPRPRYACPASYLELFDLNMRVDGRTNGIQKYTFDYTSSPYYETLYNENHIRNQKLYKNVSKMFDTKTAIGLNVFESMKKYENCVIPQEIEGTSDFEKMFFSAGSKMLSTSGIPLVYNNNDDTVMIIGENARSIDLSKIKNAIIDLSAAEILLERGIDIGLLQKNKKILPKTEYFIDYKENVNVSGTSSFDIEINKSAVIKSEFTMPDETKAIASYEYKNKDNQKFLVYAFNLYFNNEIIYRNYCRPRQIVDVINSYFKQKLPAYSLFNPDLYLQCKKDNLSMAVSVSNFSPDHLYNVKINLDKKYKSIKFINAKGKLFGDYVIIDYLSPFTFSAFEVK